MANGDDLGFVPTKAAPAMPPPSADDLGFTPTPAVPRIPPGLATEATGIGPRRLGMYGSAPIESRIEDFMNPTAAYKKEHPVLGILGEGLRNLRETLTPGALAAATLFSGPGGIEGGSAAPLVPRRASVPAMSLPESQFPRVSPAPRPFAGPPQTVFNEPRQLGPVPQPERGQAPLLGAQVPQQAPTPPERVGPPVEPLQRKPLVERRLGEAGRKPTIESVVNQATGVQPLKPNMPLGQQLESGATMLEVDPIKAKYPDPEIRQLVRANGERIYQAAKGSPETLKAIHDLTRVDLRQALVNSGEDMGQQTVSNSKFAGQGSIPREEAFNRLLDKGLRPEQIVRLAKQVPVKQ